MSEQKKFLVKLTPEDVGGLPRTVRFVLGNGVEVRACLDDFSEQMIERLALHGLSQKVGDSTSSLSKERDFHGAFGNMQGVVDNLMNDLWSARAGSGTSDLVAAIAKLQGIELEEAQAAVDKATEEQIAAFKKHPAIVAEIKRAQAERANELAKKASDSAVDLGSLMAEIMK